MISILMPYHGNRVQQLARTMWMLNRQTTSDNFELCIINDGGELVLPNMKLDTMFVRIMNMRDNNSAWCKPNFALEYGYKQCRGDFIIVTSPEILVPYNAIEMMHTYGNVDTMLVPILYRLSKKQQEDIDTIDWKANIHNLKTLQGFFYDETQPGGFTNNEAYNVRHHGGFVGAKKSVWDEIGFTPPETSMNYVSDSYWHTRMMEQGKLPFALNLSVYHQWHERKDEEYSVRMKRIRDTR